MKLKHNALFALTILLLTTTLSSCFLWHDKNRADRGRRFPHEEPRKEKKQNR